MRKPAFCICLCEKPCQTKGQITCASVKADQSLNFCPLDSIMSLFPNSYEIFKPLVFAAWFALDLDENSKVRFCLDEAHFNITFLNYCRMCCYCNFPNYSGTAKFDVITYF